MAGKRRSWESLSPDYRKRLSRYGITKSQYENGRPLSGARGHGATPEHPKEAKRNPKKYGDYIRTRAVPELPAAAIPNDVVDYAYELNAARDAAYLHTRQTLRHYVKYNDATVRANIYGGTTLESGPVPGMTLAECNWTKNATEEELRAHAYPQYRANPWFYH